MDAVYARLLVYNVVVKWIGIGVGIPPKRVTVSRNFGGPPPSGYGFTEGNYIKMCNEITPVIAQASGRAFTLPGKWRLKYSHGSISAFISAAAERLLDAREEAFQSFAREFAESQSP